MTICKTKPNQKPRGVEKNKAMGRHRTGEEGFSFLICINNTINEITTKTPSGDKILGLRVPLEDLT